MSENVKMPALGESVTEGTVTRWLKEVGETVEIDEPLLEVSTDKVDTEVPSPVAGTLQEILVQEDEEAEVGADLAVIGEGEAPAADAGDSGAAETADDSETVDDSEPATEDEGENLASDPTTAPSTSDDGGEAATEPAPDSGSEDTGSDDAGSGSDDAGSGDGEGSEVTMPALGESVTEGTVTRWLKEVGETVEVDEPLLEVSTDKVDTEVPSPVAGTLQEIVVQEDEEAEVGAVLAIVGSGAAPSGGTSDEQPAADEQQAKEKQPEPEAEQKPAEAKPEPEEQPQPTAETSGDSAEKKQAEGPQARTGEPSGPTATESVSGSGDGPGYVTPLVRKLASENDVDLSAVKGTGVGGRIRKQDVLEVIEQRQSAASAPAEQAPAEQAQAEQAPPEQARADQAPSAPAKTPSVPEVSSRRGSEEKMPRIRRVIAKNMMESLHSMAQLTTAVEVDLTRVAQLRARAKDEFLAREGAKLTFLPFITLAAVEALKAHPVINATVDEDMIRYHGSENVGIAADTPRGLIVPVIKNAGDLNLAGLARQIGDLGARAKSNKLGMDDLQGATFTITNTGSGGALWDTPIVPTPQVGILGTGTITKRPVVISGPEGDTIAIRSMMYLFLSYDHRLVDGSDAALYLTTVKKRLEEGAFEAEVGL